MKPTYVLVWTDRETGDLKTEEIPTFKLARKRAMFLTIEARGSVAIKKVKE